MSWLQPASPQVASNGRNKVALKPGHSLMDWVRLKSKHRPVQPRRITPQELSLHNKPGDVWTALNGAVYDITEYADYHPGGEEELMRGAGIDSTDLFNEVHKWVNFQNMLKEYLIGYLVQPSKVSLEVPGQTSLAVPQMKPPNITSPVTAATKFNYNSYQTERCYTLIIYGRIAASNKIKSCYFYGTINMKSIRVFVHCLDEKFLLDLQLFANLKKFDIRNSRLKFEIVIHKQHEMMWPNEGTHSPQSKTVSSKSDNLEKFEVNCVEKVIITHDTVLLTFKFINNFYAVPPLGSHVFVLNPDKDSLIDKKPYTVYDVVDQSTFKLLVKQYDGGVMSTYITSLQINQTVQMEGFDHSIDMNVLHRNRDIVILAAGTGITPFYRIMKEISANELFSNHNCALMFFNKTLKDLLVKDQLEELQFNHSKMEIVHILSQECWDGLTGRIELSHLERFTSEALYLICGPKLFIEKAVTVLSDKNVKKSNIIEFNG